MGIEWLGQEYFSLFSASTHAKQVSCCIGSQAMIQKVHYIMESIRRAHSFLTESPIASLKGFAIEYLKSPHLVPQSPPILVKVHPRLKLQIEKNHAWGQCQALSDKSKQKCLNDRSPKTMFNGLDP